MLTRSVRLALACLSAASLPLFAQAPDRPIARMHHNLAWDHATRRVVMFGGANQPQMLDDLWSWDGTRWSLIAHTNVASAGHALFSDARGALFFAAGTSKQSARWMGKQWQTVSTDPLSHRAAFAAAYDTTRGRLVVHGGSVVPRQPLGDTLEFDGAAWKQVATTGPSARITGSMAYDSARGVAVMFGGFDEGTRSRLGDTWEWNGTTWRQMTPASSPPPRNAAGIVYDPVRKNVVLFGGMDANGALLNETWLYDGVTWRRAAVAGPSARAETYMAFDLARGVAVLFGGDADTALLDDTWEWNGTAWTKR